LKTQRRIKVQFKATLQSRFTKRLAIHPTDKVACVTLMDSQAFCSFEQGKVCILTRLRLCQRDWVWGDALHAQNQHQGPKMGFLRECASAQAPHFWGLL